MTNVNDFFCFIGLVFFKKEKKRVFLYIHVLLHRVIVTWYMVLMLKANQMFLKCFLVILIWLKYLNDSLNIVLILSHGREFFWAKCVQFLLAFSEWN